MTDREKLIALLGRMSCDVIGIDSCDTCEHRYEIDCTAHTYADHLIANGVVVREKGEWKDGKCSNCHEEALSTSWDEPVYDYDWEENLRYSHTEKHTEYHLTSFCPNCGADMRKGENG